MVFDELEVRADPSRLVRRRNLVHGSDEVDFHRVELRVNGIGLIDIIREVELPHACQEFDERVAAGEPAEELGPRGSLAGAYQYLLGAFVFLPSRNLLGEAHRHGFRAEPDDPLNRKSLLLYCTCGIIDCWFLLATIEVTKDTVTWSDFCQFHRDWPYDMRPFVFDRKAYETQLVAPPMPV